MKRNFLPIIFISLMMLLMGCGAPRTLKIGLIAPFEGQDRAIGYEALFAAKLAIQERNMAGGVGGYQLELIALNDFNEPTEAAHQAHALLADAAVVGVIGHYSNRATQAALPIYQQAEFAVVVPWSIEPLHGDSGTVSVAATLPETAQALQQQLALTQTITLTNLNSDLTWPSTAVINLATDGVTAGHWVAAIRARTPQQRVVGQAESGSQQVVQIAGEAANGFIFVSPSPAEATTSFEVAYHEMSGLPPSPRAILTYDATHILLDALHEAMILNNGKVDRTIISQHIQTVQRQGLTGAIAFDEQGQRRDAPIWIYKITEASYPGIIIAP